MIQAASRRRQLSLKAKLLHCPLRLRAAGEVQAGQRMTEVMPGAAGHPSILMSRALCREIATWLDS